MSEAISNIYLGLTPDEAQKKMDADVAAQVAAYQKMEFATHRKDIAKLTFDQKLSWYAFQNPQVIITLGNNKEFQRFWLWHVMVPMRIRRLYYRVKNGEIFKHYQHISEMKEGRKKGGPELI